MRIRQIKPEWWLDKPLRSGTTAGQREVYIGLWMIADDAGWLRWDVETIAAQLFPFDPIRRRERLVESARGALSALEPEAPHLIVHGCGHAEVPKVRKHQRSGGRPAYGIRDAHERDCSGPVRNHPDGASTESSARNREQGTGNREQGTGLAPRAARPPEVDAAGDVAMNDSAFDPQLWTRVTSLVEGITGRPHGGLGSSQDGFGAFALDQAQAVPWSQFEEAYRSVASAHGGRPTVRQLLFDAEDVLRPTGLMKGKANGKPTPGYAHPQEEIDRAVRRSS